MKTNYRIKGNELILEECVACGNKRWNLQISLSPDKPGIVHAWCCNFGGDIEKLRYKEGWRELYDIYRSTYKGEYGLSKKEVMLPVEGLIDVRFCKDERILEYLQSRGLSKADWKNWNIKVRYPFIYFLLTSCGKEIYWVGQNISTRKYLLPSIPKKDLVWYVSSESSIVLLVEGVFDAIRVVQAQFDVVILLGKRLYAKTREFITKFLGDKKIVVALDADASRDALDILTGFKGRKVYKLSYSPLEIENNVDIADLNPRKLREKVDHAKIWTFADEIKMRMGK